MTGTGQEGPAYLVEGRDPALVARQVHDLVARLVGEADRSLVVEEFAGEEVDLAAVADGCATPPLLVDRRVVVVRDVGLYTAEQLAPILTYLRDPLASTALVLVAGGGRASAKLAGAVTGAGGTVLDADVPAGKAADWLRERLRDAPVRLDAAAAQVVREHLVEDVGRLPALLEVLAAAYGEGARVGRAEIEPYLGEASTVAPWAFTDAIDSGDAEAALTAMRRLLRAGGRHPLEVFGILRSHVQSRLRVDGPSITTEAEAARALGIGQGRSTYPAKKALAGARQWGSEAVGEAVLLVADAELDLKGASAWPPEPILEVLVARLCRLAGRGAGTASRRRPPVRGGAGSRAGAPPARRVG